MRKVLMMALAAMAASWYAEHRRSRHHALATPASPPEPLRRWEDEGGGSSGDGSHIASQVRTDDVLSPGEGSAAAQRRPLGL